MAKIDEFDEVITSSQVENKRTYAGLLNEYADILRIITIYHDIGKIRSKLNHGEHSFDIIQETELLNHLALDAYAKTLVGSVIRHHLALGTIFTGEWSVKKLYLLNEQIGMKNKEEVFYHILVMFSVLDTWSYVDDRVDAIRLLYNYDQIIQRFRQDSLENHMKTNLVWRLCCFLGSWRKGNYLEEKTMLQYERVFLDKMESYYNCNVEVVRK